MPDLITFVTFNDQAEEAARFYTSIVPDSRITRLARYPRIPTPPDAPPDAPPPPSPGGVMTVEFELLGRPFVALNGGPQFSFTQGISISVQCDTQDEVDRYWNALTADGGREIACGWLTDKFGVSWQVNPTLLMDMVTDPDPAKAGKAMAAMITMVKIDLEAVKQAWAE